MRLFNCQHCRQIVFFENRRCERCSHRLGYVADRFEMLALAPASPQPGAPYAPPIQLTAPMPSGEAAQIWTAAGAPGGGTAETWRFCANAEMDACNWLIPAGSPDRFCAACRHNRTVPDLSEPENILAWRKMEIAKHRLIYSLTRLGLPHPNRVDDAAAGLVFDFLADPPGEGNHVLTGHDEGLVTLALQEANDAERERRRTAMGEPYRTLIGHFRHEVGHYYWDRLVRDQGLQAESRAVFGDDEADYMDALKRHYENGPPPKWRESFVSSYATSHAWEDWAETWAHYLHIVDSLETAGAFGLEVHPEGAGPHLHASVQLDPYGPGPFERLVEAWLPLTYAMNAMNRSMGLADLYPFILSGPVIRKLAFVHDLVHRPRAAASKAA